MNKSMLPYDAAAAVYVVLTVLGKPRVESQPSRGELFTQNEFKPGDFYHARGDQPTVTTRRLERGRNYRA